MTNENDESAERRNQLIGERKAGGWPAWELRAQHFLGGVKHWIQKGGEEAFVAFHADFLSLLDAFLSQLIVWTEEESSQPVKQWAGSALAERVHFLKSQERYWRMTNSAFADTRARFGDRRHARSPRSYLGWLAGDYLRDVILEKRFAPTFLQRSPLIANGHQSPAEILNYPDDVKNWLKKLSELPDFSEDSAAQWAEVVYEKMEKNEEEIFKRPGMRKLASQRARHGPGRSDRKLQLYDFKHTITRAVAKIARNPPGFIRGVTRPG